MFVEIGKCIGFCLYRRSYLLWSPIIQDVAVEDYGCDLEKGWGISRLLASHLPLVGANCMRTV